MAMTPTLLSSTKREGVYDHDHLFHPKPKGELLSRRLCGLAIRKKAGIDEGGKVGITFARQVTPST